uniref:Uncharacterized protein n=1 Tax=Rhizophora mucronata TaxID=61149 RepID=A0A2P2PW29_RHIMU
MSSGSSYKNYLSGTT